jgi:chorismate-pyruvate lyase
MSKSTTLTPNRPSAVATPFPYPLDEFYDQLRLPRPTLSLLDPGQVPEPYRSLLVHSRDMTPTLEAFHGTNIHIEVLRRERGQDTYFRAVALRRDDNDRPLEFGVNRIYLSHFPTEIRWMIRQEKLPLGRILQDHALPHRTRTVLFFQILSDGLINRALDLTQSEFLYGRQAILSNAQGEPLSEVVEILPPLPLPRLA